jgi:hypothetical protein
MLTDYRSRMLAVVCAGWLVSAGVVWAAPVPVARENKVARLGTLSFTGNSFVTADELKNHLATADGTLEILRDREALATKSVFAATEKDREALARYYYQFGFHDVQISQSVRLSAEGRVLEITFHIVEGSRVRNAPPGAAGGVNPVPGQPGAAGEVPGLRP